MADQPFNPFASSNSFTPAGADTRIGLTLYCWGNGVNLRTGPGTMYPSQRKADRGQALGKITAVLSGWYEFEAPANFVQTNASTVKLYVSSSYAGITPAAQAQNTQPENPKPKTNSGSPSGPGEATGDTTQQAGMGKWLGLGLLAFALGGALRRAR